MFAEEKEALQLGGGSLQFTLLYGTCIRHPDITMSIHSTICMYIHTEARTEEVQCCDMGRSN
jgi:hypothetical protein